MVKKWNRKSNRKVI